MKHLSLILWLALSMQAHAADTADTAENSSECEADEFRKQYLVLSFPTGKTWLLFAGIWAGLNLMYWLLVIYQRY